MYVSEAIAQWIGIYRIASNFIHIFTYILSMSFIVHDLFLQHLLAIYK